MVTIRGGQWIEAYQRWGKFFGNIDQANELKAFRLVDERLAEYTAIGIDVARMCGMS